MQCPQRYHFLSYNAKILAKNEESNDTELKSKEWVWWIASVESNLTMSQNLIHGALWYTPTSRSHPLLMSYSAGERRHGAELLNTDKFPKD